MQQEGPHTGDAIANLNKGCDIVAPRVDPPGFHGVGIALHPYQR